MAKSLIIGGFYNYKFNDVKVWAQSIEDCGFKGDKAVVCLKTDLQTAEKLAEIGFDVIMVDDKDINPKIPIHVQRFIFIYEYLRTVGDKYDYVITTDVKDVFFQTDPEKWLEENLGDYQMVTTSEALVYKDEPWGNENLHNTFGPYIHEIYKDKTIYNVGVLGGRSEYIKDICLMINLMGINRPIPVVDQAVFNFMIYTSLMRKDVLFSPQSEGWACHAGTTVDPAKIGQFRKNLLEEEPTFKDGIFYTSKETPFCIVHQYDRVPEWNKFLRQKYELTQEQNKDAGYIIYRTA